MTLHIEAPVCSQQILKVITEPIANGLPEHCSTLLVEPLGVLVLTLFELFESSLMLVRRVFETRGALLDICETVLDICETVLDICETVFDICETLVDGFNNLTNEVQPLVHGGYRLLHGRDRLHQGSLNALHGRDRLHETIKGSLNVLNGGHRR